jgi:hypothetical protein
LIKTAAQAISIIEEQNHLKWIESLGPQERLEYIARRIKEHQEYFPDVDIEKIFQGHKEELLA